VRTAIRNDKKPAAVVTFPDRKTVKANDNDDDFARKWNVGSSSKVVGAFVYWD
jgi:hypothetical protein